MKLKNKIMEKKTKYLLKWAPIITLLLFSLITISSIRLYNCARVDDIISIKHEIRVGINPQIIEEHINQLEKKDYFDAVKYDIIEVRRRNEQNKELWRLYH